MLGEVNRRFVVSPNVEALIAALDEKDRAVASEAANVGEGLHKMDTS